MQAKPDVVDGLALRKLDKRKRSKKAKTSNSGQKNERIKVAKIVENGKAEEGIEASKLALHSNQNDHDRRSPKIGAEEVEKNKNGTVRRGDQNGSKNRNNVVKFEDSSEEEDGGIERVLDNEKKSKGYRKKRAQNLYENRRDLPVFQHKEEILSHFDRNQVTILVGETGSGKSTQIPQFLLEGQNKRIAVTQPRRVAALSLAQRVSEEYGCALGEEVGYQIRFANVSDPKKTKLKYLTDGMLLRELMLDNTLSRYSVIIIDEAHERTVLTDIILGFLKDLILTKRRNDLKIIVMSATLNAELFSRFFHNAPVLYVKGKTFPVSKMYLSESTESIVDTMLRCIIQVNITEPEGDILCFLPGQEEIDECVGTLAKVAPFLPKEAPLIEPFPLYAALSPLQQLKVFAKYPRGHRKVVVATNIAETSVTISGVKYVIDSGLRKIKVWRHQLGISTLLTTPISQSSAKQRAGRAGRESPGKVFRLYLEKQFLSQLPKEQEPEILRNDIILPILTLKKSGVNDLLNWSWIEYPGRDAILQGLATLYNLGALDDNGRVTSIGYKMSVLPLHPQLSAVLLHALQMGVLGVVIDIVACLSVENLILNVPSINGELRDEVNTKRLSYCPKGNHYGDLIAMKEYFDYFRTLMENNDISEAKSWCKELFISYKGFKNVLRVREQLKAYMRSTARQDFSLVPQEKEKTFLEINQQLDDSSFATKVGESNDEQVQQSYDIAAILKSFLKSYVNNCAIGMPDRSFRSCSTGHLIKIHPSSVLFGKPNKDSIFYIEYVYTNKAYGRICSAIELTWLEEVASHSLGTSKINIAG